MLEMGNLDDLRVLWLGDQEKLNPETKWIYIFICIGVYMKGLAVLELFGHRWNYYMLKPPLARHCIDCLFYGCQSLQNFVVFVAGLVLMAGLMSGLTLGLMSMDSIDLEVC